MTNPLSIDLIQSLSKKSLARLCLAYNCLVQLGLTKLQALQIIDRLLREGKFND